MCEQAWQAWQAWLMAKARRDAGAPFEDTQPMAAGEIRPAPPI